MIESFLYIDQGSNYSQVLETGFNLAGYTAVAQIRKWYDGSEYDYVNALVTNAATGQITLSMSAEDTAFLKPGRNVFDVLATHSSGNRLRVAQGQAIVSPGLTGVNPTTSTTSDDNVLLEMTQGSDFEHTIELRDPDGSIKSLVGYTAEMQIRPTVDSPIVIMELSTANSRLQINGSAGTVTIHLSAVETGSFTFDTAVYDIEITSPTSEVTRILQGTIVLSLNITK